MNADPHAIADALMAADHLTIGAAIAFGTFILEDVALVAAGLLAGREIVNPVFGFIALYLGIVLGDLGLYGLGRLAGRWAWLKARIAPRWQQIAGDVLAPRLVPAVFGARAVPGLRLTTYTLAGWLGLPFRRFALAVIGAALVWTLPVYIGICVFGMTVLAERPWWVSILAGLGLAGLMALVPALLGRLTRRRALSTTGF